MGLRMRNYRAMTSIAAPLVPLWLAWRQFAGKEDAKRMRERFGYASAARPEGTLLWLHAASVGEANSVLMLIHKIKERHPNIKILLTTGTVTSAKLMQARLPKDAIHQFAPVDTPQATERFIWHWRPDIALWVESELWPNMIAAANTSECFMGLINARMSERSFKRWNKHTRMIGDLLSCFNAVYAQSEDDAKRLTALGARDVECLGNLKYDAALLPCNEDELTTLKTVLGERPVWLAASTHPGEEEQIAAVHAQLTATRPNLLTVIVPRHPNRGPAIAEALQKKLRVSLRSKKEPIGQRTQLYIADTLGELGLFYRLCEIVFMGGSLIPHGGQNPLEPARLSCAILFGPHTHNFADIYQQMQQLQIALNVKDTKHLAAELERILNNADAKNALQTGARRWVESKSGTAQRLLAALAPVLAEKKKAA